MPLQVSPQIHEQAIRHLQNLRDFSNLASWLHCVAGQGGGYGPANPETLFWAWGGGFDDVNLSLTIEDGNGNILSPVPAVQSVAVSGGLFSTTFRWERHAVPSFDGLPAPVLHAKTTTAVESWAQLRVEDVYIAAS